MNYQIEMEKILNRIVADNETPSLLLHSCCAPCSSYCIEYLSDYFNITVFYYNPNISADEEYKKRVQEQIRLIETMKTRNKVDYCIADYEPDRFYAAVKGLEKEPEGGARCVECYRLRLDKTAEYAKAKGFDYFTTTLTISPLKNSDKLNAIGLELAQIYNVPYLVSDFKKKNGYKRSIELSREYNLYRQNYCGCVYSQQETLMKLQMKTASDIIL